MLAFLARLLAVVPLVTAGATQQTSFTTSVSQLDEWKDYAEQLMLTFGLPGLSVAIVRDREEAEFLNLGKALGDGTPVSEDTLFYIASTSKAFLSASLGLLIDDFAHTRNVTPLPPDVTLDWDTKVKDLLGDEWELQDEWASEKASLRDLLGHVTGLPRHEMSYRLDQPLADVVRRLRYLRPAHELREKYGYSNQMYMTLSYIISLFSAVPYPSFVQTRLFSPLNMSSSTYYPQTAFSTGKFADCFFNYAGKWKNETRRVPFFLGREPEEGTVRMNAGPGGVMSCTRDTANWVKMLLSSGFHSPSGTQVVPRSVIDTVTTGHTLKRGFAAYPELSPQSYGAGWTRESYQGHELVWHDGGIMGFSSLVSLYPNDGLGIVLLSNGNADPVLNSLAYRIAEDVLGMKRVDWPARYLSNLRQLVQPLAAPPSLPARTPSDRRLPDLSRFSGTYCDQGYGNFTLCAFPFSPSSSDPACSFVFDSFRAIDPSLASKADRTLWGEWTTLASTHVTLTLLPGSGREFEISVMRIFEHGYGNDKSPFYIHEEDLGAGTAVAEFDLEDGEVKGVGMWGVQGVPRRGRDEGAEVWFGKVAEK